MNGIITLVFYSLIFSNKSQIYTKGSGVTDINGDPYQTITINGQMDI
jgi:hypothetical protein